MSQMSTLNPALFQEKAGQAAALIRAMSNEHRLMILCQLGDAERSVGEIGQTTALSQSALSQHLAVLREQDLVATRRSGQQIFYRIAHPVVLQLITVLGRHFCPDVFE